MSYFTSMSMFFIVLCATFGTYLVYPLTTDTYWLYHLLSGIGIPFFFYPFCLAFSHSLLNAPRYKLQFNCFTLAFYLAIALALLSTFYNEFIVDLKEHGPDSTVQWVHVISDMVGILMFIVLVQYLLPLLKSSSDVQKNT